MLINVQTELRRYEEKLNSLNEMDQKIDKFNTYDRGVISSILEQFVETGALSAAQWRYAEGLLSKIQDQEPIYGNFDAIQVMFTLAGEKLKAPKIRLLSDEGVFVQLTFIPDSKDILIHRDGWQGHGRRKFIGVIKNNMMTPQKKDALTDDIKKVIHEFSLDPKAVALAMSHKLGVCMFCAHRLSDDTSKALGYGPICAKNYGLPRTITKEGVTPPPGNYNENYVTCKL